MSIVDFPQQGTIGENLLPTRYDIKLYQGDTFRFILALKSGGVATDITGWTALAQIKKVVDSSPAETPSLTAVVGGVDGKVTISLSDTGSAALQGDTDYKYDVQLTDASGNKRTFIGGIITVTEDISE